MLNQLKVPQFKLKQVTFLASAAYCTQEEAQIMNSQVQGQDIRNCWNDGDGALKAMYTISTIEKFHHRQPMGKCDHGVLFKTNEPTQPIFPENLGGLEVHSKYCDDEVQAKIFRKLDGIHLR